MKACIVGAGAIGGWIAGLLADAGNDVCLLARGETLAALNASGLAVRRKGKEQVYRLRASDDAVALGPQDAVIIAVKGQSVPAIAPSVTALCGKDTIVVPAVNGIPWWFFQVPGVPQSGFALSSVDPGGETGKAIAPERVIGCVVHASAWTPQPGIVEVNGEDKLIFGEPDGAKSARLADFAAAFATPLTVTSGNIRRDIWLKLWGNMTMNPLSVLTGATTLQMLSDPDVRELVRSMMIEMQAVGTQIGLPIPLTAEDRMAITRKLGDIKTSMLRDWEARRELEIAPILGVLAEIAGRVQVPAPFLHAVLGLLRLRAEIGA
ncbi:MAG: 2-dehydropantoate 2-reductase [Proteobacteria bacterium]|nr:2-dehydropantoate 2-reductase [Pseudomonadota bacterium]